MNICSCPAFSLVVVVRLCANCIRIVLMCLVGFKELRHYNTKLIERHLNIWETCLSNNGMQLKPQKASKSLIGVQLRQVLSSSNLWSPVIPPHAPCPLILYLHQTNPSTRGGTSGTPRLEPPPARRACSDPDSPHLSLNAFVHS